MSARCTNLPDLYFTYGPIKIAGLTSKRRPGRTDAIAYIYRDLWRVGHSRLLGRVAVTTSDPKQYVLVISNKGKTYFSPRFSRRPGSVPWLNHRESSKCDMAGAGGFDYAALRARDSQGAQEQGGTSNLMIGIATKSIACLTERCPSL